MQMTAMNPFFFSKERAGGAFCLALAGVRVTTLLRMVTSDGIPNSNAPVSLSYSKHAPVDLTVPFGNCRPLLVHRHAWGVFKQTSSEKALGIRRRLPDPPSCPWPASQMPAFGSQWCWGIFEVLVEEISLNDPKGGCWCLSGICLTLESRKVIQAELRGFSVCSGPPRPHPSSTAASGTDQPLPVALFHLGGF